MPAQRTPGPLGLWPDPSPGPKGPWEAWPSRPAHPSGPAANALHETGPVGLYQRLPDASFEDEAEDESPKPIERFRYMEIQGETVKVRCVPLWQGWALGMLGACDDDEKAQHKLVQAVKSHKPETRASMVGFLMGQLNSEGKGGSPIAGRLAKIRLSQEGEDVNGAPGGMAGGLPAVQRGRRFVNG